LTQETTIQLPMALATTLTQWPAWWHAT